MGARIGDAHAEGEGLPDGWRARGPDAGQPGGGAWRWRLSLLVLLVVWADILFWAHRPGLSVALFFLSVMGGATLVSGGRRIGLSWLVGTLCQLPVIENLSLLSFLFAFGGLLAAAALQFLGPPLSGERILAATLRFGLGLTWRSGQALFLALPRAGAAFGPGITTGRIARAWALPAAAGLLFLLLFADANPILSALLARSFAFDWLTGALVGRIIFWAMVGYCCWPFLARDGVEDWAHGAGPRAEPAAWTRPGLINAASVGNSLVLFNAMFAAQTLSDLRYLWSGAPLPDGMTLAEYAHRGAYPLVLTALLAGLFALLSRPFVERNRRLLALLGLWLGQNGLLVLSAAYRLDLYVGAYGLTYLRVAAFVWMGLVAVGLGLIFWQICGRRGNGWLVTRIAASALVALYACGFVNFADMIARRNIGLYQESPALGLDCAYLRSLGEFAVPATQDHRTLVMAVCGHDGFPERQERGWRDWSLRSWRQGESSLSGRGPGALPPDPRDI